MRSTLSEVRPRMMSRLSTVHMVRLVQFGDGMTGQDYPETSFLTKQGALVN